MAKMVFLRLATTCLLAALSACGGDGSDAPLAAPTPNPAPNPPPPVSDTTAPRVTSVSPGAGAADVPVTIGQVTVGFSEAVQCESVSIALASDGAAVTGSVSCTADNKSATLRFVPETRLLYGSEYPVTVGAHDTAGNRLAAAVWATFTTEALPATVTTKLYTANNAESILKNTQAVTGVDLASDHALEHYSFTGYGGGANQWNIATDSRAGRVYSSAFGFRGLDAVDLVSGATSKIELDPETALLEDVVSIAIQDQYVIAATAYRGVLLDTTSRLYFIDRLTGTIVGKTSVLGGTGDTITKVVTHPNPAVQRVYVVMAKMNSIFSTFDCGVNGQNSPMVCKTFYTASAPGKIVEVDSTTFTVIRTLATVGSAPVDALVDVMTERLIVANAGDRSLSAVDLDTGAVTTTTLAGWTKYQQPVALALDPASRRLYVADYLDAITVLDADSFASLGNVPVGPLTLPRSLVAHDGMVYAGLFRTSEVAALSGTTLDWKTSIGGYGPNGIAIFVR